MRKFFSGKRFKALLFIMGAIFAGAVLALITKSGSSPITSAAGVILSPVQRLSSFVSEKLSDAGASFRSGNVYLQRIDELEKQVSEYEKMLVDYEQLKQKTESYQSVLGIKEENPDFELTAADIIGRDPLDAFYSFIIDKGSLKGVSVNDPVIYGNYVVGVVHSVKATYSVVWTVLNPKVNISAFETRTRESGYTTTTAEYSGKNLCLFSGLEKSTEVAVGGMVCTSGLGGIYPKGLIIGKITEIVDSKVDFSVNAAITPGIELSELEDVFVITGFEEQGVSDE